MPAFDIVGWSTRNHMLALYRGCRCKEALEAMAGIGMLSSVPTELAQNVTREDTVSTIKSRGESRSISIAQSWDQQRQAEAMIEHNIARDFGNDLRKAAAGTKTQFLIITAEDDRVVTPQPALEFAIQVGATVVEMDEDCGHGDPWCAPDTFAKAVSAFINKD